MAELVHHVRSGDVARPSSMFPASSVAGNNNNRILLDPITLFFFPFFLTALPFIFFSPPFFLFPFFGRRPDGQLSF